MTAQQTAKLTRYNAIISQLSKEATALATIPALQRAFNLFVTLVAAINSLGPKREEGSSGETTTKEEARSRLIEDLTTLAAQIRGWANEHHDVMAAQKAAYNASDFTRMKGAVLPNEGESLYHWAVENKAALADAGITDESLEAIAHLINDYSDKASLPRNKIATRKTHGQNLESLFEETDTVLEERIENLMMGLKKKFPDVYATFLNNNKTVNPPTASAKTKAARAAKKAAKQQLNHTTANAV